MATKALIEVHYLPSVQFFSKLLAFEEVIIEQCENYQKGSYRNRCHLAGANSLQILSIPLEKGKHQKLPIQEVRIAYTHTWHLQHWRTIRSAYASAPFFPYYADALELLFTKRPDRLFDFNRDLLNLLCSQLGIRTTISYSVDYLIDPGPDILDLRDRISPKDPPEGSDPQFQAVPYPQVFLERHGFLPNLSILDLLFCTGPEARQILRSCIVTKDT